MSKYFKWLLLLLAIYLIWNRCAHLFIATNRVIASVGLVYDPGAADSSVRNAYESVLQEEGIPHRWISYHDFILQDGRDQLHRFQALIFPDALCRTIPIDVASRAKQFAQCGGKVLVVFDAGTRDRRGHYRKKGIFVNLLGVDYVQYDRLRNAAYLTSHLKFNSAADAAYWQIPPGKVSPSNELMSYIYGPMNFSVPATRLTSSSTRVYASSPFGPVLSRRPVGKGEAVWIGIPLGALKASGDDLELRAFLRTFVETIAELPHLVPSPRGLGGLVIDWHVDYNGEWIWLPSMLSHHLVRKGIHYEFDVTAGPDNNHPGDGEGFDAAGRGRPLVKEIMHYGWIGSHGGWLHNWFAHNLERHKLSRREILHLVQINDECLQNITGYPIISYAAPQGVHPQPEMTEILQQLGMCAYYYTGDAGSAPNRTFYNGRMVSKKVVAFPIMPNQNTASFYEMGEKHFSTQEIETWLDGTMKYVIKQRTVRLIYSHPHDLNTPQLRHAFSHFIDGVQVELRKGDLQVEPMYVYAHFLLRLVKTRTSFTRIKGEWIVHLSNPQGLNDVCIDMPAALLQKSFTLPATVSSRKTGDHWLFTILPDLQDLTLQLPAAKN